MLRLTFAKIVTCLWWLLLSLPANEAFFLKSSQHRQQVTRRTFGGLDVSLAAASAEEDLELTRQIIWEHIRKTEGYSNDFEEDDDDEAATSDSWLLDITYQRKESYTRPTPPTQNDLMIRAALGQNVEKTPVWLFRQAGRHLPEYEEYKKSTGRNFLELLAFPDSVAECTMQPLRRYDLDAAILFSDILVIPEALGIEVSMPGGVGIQVPHPLTGSEEVATRIPKLDDMTPEFIQEKLGHVIQAVSLIRTKMQEEQRDIPLIGFSAAPWTLLYYMVGGSSKKNTDIGVKWLTEYTAESKELLRVLTKVVVEYLSAQVEAGAHMLQIFEAMGMMIDEENFYKYALPCLKEIGTELKRRFPEVPIMVFCRGACFANGEVAQVGCFDVITIDGSVDRASARGIVGDSVALQGNYDPNEFIEDGGNKTPETVRQTAKQLLHELGPQRFIANLGEGLGGKESPSLVKVFVDAIHEESAAMIAAVSKDS